MKAHADRKCICPECRGYEQAMEDALAGFTITVTPIEAAKSRFLAVCAEWADLIITDGIVSKERNNDIRAIKPEDFIPKVAYGEQAKTAASDAVLLFLGEAYKLVTETMGTSQVVREAVERAYRANIKRDYALGQLRVDELPKAQRKVWLAGYQLMLDSWDAAPGPKTDSTDE